MNKILLVLKREYTTRVRKKAFIITTLLLPLLYFGLIFGTAFISSRSTVNTKIAVIDQSGYFTPERISRENIKDTSTVLVATPPQLTDSVLRNFQSLGYDGYILIPAQNNWEKGFSDIPLYTEKTFGIGTSDNIQRRLNNIWNEIKNEKLGIQDSARTIIATSTVKLLPMNTKEEKTNSGVASMTGTVAGFLIYFILLIYGSQVMMGVMEEKTNRIAEVIVSSVKPFQLMLGKIIGIALVGLTQFALWIALIFVIYNLSQSASIAGGSATEIVGRVQEAFGSINVPLIIICFIFYFLGGFFFYASLYAAIGSAVNEDMREAQSLSFPVTMLVIFSFVMMTAAMNDPTGPIAFWGSMLPFSSPIIMMARIPFGVPGTVPYWQLFLSMGILIVSFLLMVWLCGKIYRTGILMYGKKPTWKELIKWTFKK